ncbi:MAG: hypothetical protein VW397_08535, partial [Candidatus Margulisiibacteriota bacterium]
MIDEGWYNLTDASKQAFVKSFNPDDLTGTVVDVLNEDLRWDNYKSQQNSNANSNPIDPASSNQTNTSATANQTTASGVAAANQTAESAAANQTTASGVASTDTAGTTLPSQKEMAARRNVLVELQGRMSKIEGAASVPIGALNQQPSIAGNASVTIGALKETPTTVGNLTDIQDNPTEYMNTLKGDIEQRLTAAGTTLTNGTIEVNERG